MLGLSLDEAKNVALVAATVFAIGAIAAIWMMKTIVQKVLVAVLLVMLAFAAWSQRESLQECAGPGPGERDDRHRRTTSAASPTSTDAGDTGVDPNGVEPTPTPTAATCTFFGVDVTIP